MKVFSENMHFRQLSRGLLELTPSDRLTPRYSSIATLDTGHIQDDKAQLIVWIERVEQRLQAIEHSLSMASALEQFDKESIQAEVTALCSYLDTLREFTTSFHDLTRSAAATRAETRSTSKLPSTVHEALSKRELEVLSYMATGMSNQEIAQAIVVTVGTVKRHINNIYTKFNVHSRIQAIVYAQTHKILPA